MNRYITYNNNRYSKLIFKVSPYAEFSSILKKLTSLAFENCIFDHEHILYAVLELVNNSLRAHREKKETGNIIVTFALKRNNLTISVSDWGGGFDKSTLPYDIEADSNDVQPHGENFEKYREKHNYLRFGMGLLLAKRTFNHFSISFKDRNGDPMGWVPGQTAGTVINLGIDVSGIDGKRQTRQSA